MTPTAPRTFPAALLLLALFMPTLAAANPGPLPERDPKNWKGGATSRYVWTTSLDVPTWVIDCESGASDCQEKAPLYWYPGGPQQGPGWGSFGEYQAAAKPGFAAPSGLARVEVSKGITLTVTLAARRVMGSQGATLKGSVLSTSEEDIDLNSDGKTRSARIEVDPNNNAALLLTAVNKDGSTDHVRVHGGKATPLLQR